MKLGFLIMKIHKIKQKNLLYDGTLTVNGKIYFFIFDIPNNSISKTSIFKKHWSTSKGSNEHTLIKKYFKSG